MKWKEADFNNNIATVRAVLIYGPDAGQVDEYCDRAIEKLGIEKDNLFALDSDDLREKQDALFAESCSPSMFGGRKMVIIPMPGTVMRASYLIWCRIRDCARRCWFVGGICARAADCAACSKGATRLRHWRVIPMMRGPWGH